MLSDDSGRGRQVPLVNWAQVHRDTSVLPITHMPQGASEPAAGSPLWPAPCLASAPCLLMPKGDRSVEHVGIRDTVRSAERNSKRDDLLVVSSCPRKAPGATHDCKGPEPMRVVDPMATHRQDEHVAVGCSQRPGSVWYPGSHYDAYVPSHREAPEMCCLPPPPHTRQGDARHRVKAHCCDDPARPPFEWHLFRCCHRRRAHSEHGQD